MDDITFAEFQKLDLRTGVIKAVADIPGADKLYKLTVDIGEERILVAGIKQHYTQAELIGKTVAVIVNLEPKRLKGIESHGMILAASSGEIVTLLLPDKEINPGSKIS